MPTHPQPHLAALVDEQECEDTDLLESQRIERSVTNFVHFGYGTNLASIEKCEPVISELVDYLIQIRVRGDAEFKLALGAGYYS